MSVEAYDDCNQDLAAQSVANSRISRPEGYICRDFGRPGCCSIPDSRYTMHFDDIGEEPIYWCTFCGKEW